MAGRLASDKAPRQKSHEALSGARPSSKMRCAAAHDLSNPECSAALDIARSVCLRSALSQRSMASTSSDGMSCRIVDSPNALGLATSAGTSDRGSSPADFDEADFCVRGTRTRPGYVDLRLGRRGLGVGNVRARG